MDDYQFVGRIILILLPVLGTALSIGVPILKLNTTITELKKTVEHMNSGNTNRDKRIGNHGDRLDDHECRIIKLETRDDIEAERSDKS